MKQLNPRKIKSLRSLFIAAYSNLVLTDEINRGLKELERIAYPEKFKS